MTDNTPRDKERLADLLRGILEERDAALRDARRQIEERDATIAEQARKLSEIEKGVRAAVAQTPDALTNEQAFGWEHCRDKAILAILAPDTTAQTEGGE